MRKNHNHIPVTCKTCDLVHMQVTCSICFTVRVPYNALRITGLLSGESAGHRWFPLQRAIKILTFSLWLHWTNCWMNPWISGDLRHHEALVTSMKWQTFVKWIFVRLASSPGGRLNIKIFNQYRNPNVKDRTVLRPYYLNMGISIPEKEGLYKEAGPKRRWVNSGFGTD